MWCSIMLLMLVCMFWWIGLCRLLLKFIIVLGVICRWMVGWVCGGCGM